MQTWQILAIKLLLAMLCGGIIGFERELSHKAAGLRTNVLICMGATLYMIISRHISGGAPYSDPARLVAQVVAGIGFLGAGVILQARGSIHGLTTAATIFVVAAVGIGIGEGMFGLASVATILIMGVLVLLRQVERVLLQRRSTFQYSLKTRDPVALLERLMNLFESEGVYPEESDIEDLADGWHAVRARVTTSKEVNQRLLDKVSRLGAELRSAEAESTK